MGRRSRALAVSTIIVSAISVSPVEAVTWKLPFVDLAQMSVNQGSPVAVTFGVLYPSTCSVWLQNSFSKTKPKSYKVTQPQKTTSISTTGLRTGKYQVRVSCGSSGKAGKGVSDDIWIIPRGASTVATCTVVGQGLSPLKKSGTSYGVELKNSSPVLAAVAVTVNISFQNASGVTLSSARFLPMDIAPGDSVYLGGSEFAEGISTMRVDSNCDSSLDAPEPRLKGVGSVSALDSTIYSSRIAGEVKNTKTFTIAEYSSVAYLLRDSKGAITGGGNTSLGLLLLSQGKGSWKADSFIDPTQVSTVSWILDPMKG